MPNIDLRKWRNKLVIAAVMAMMKVIQVVLKLFNIHLAVLPREAMESLIFGVIDDDDEFDTEGISKAEMDLIKRGVQYEKDESDGWLVVGKRKNIRVHPNDTSILHYSDMIFEEDPCTFVPDRSQYSYGTYNEKEAGRVTRFGLKDPPLSEEDNSSDVPTSFMKKMTAYSNGVMIYHGKGVGQPNIQFINILIDRKQEYLERKEVRKRMKFTYILRIELVCCEKDVWRRVKVPSAISLPKLHDQVIVPTMGWNRGYHGYVFEDPVDGTVIGPGKEGYIDMMHLPMHFGKAMNGKRYPLAALLRAKGDVAYYTYDLGDRWEHRLVLEDIIPEEDVALINGKGACPPEDSNGLESRGCESYAEFLVDYKKNPSNSKMIRAVRKASQSVNYSRPWMGPPITFRPLELNLSHHRRMLNSMLSGPSVSKKGHLPNSDFKESMKGCEYCGDRLKALKWCTGCKKVSYCSKKCLKVDWINHKPDCKKWSKKRK